MGKHNNHRNGKSKQKSGTHTVRTTRGGGATGRGGPKKGGR